MTQSIINAPREILEIRSHRPARPAEGTRENRSKEPTSPDAFESLTNRHKSMSAATESSADAGGGLPPGKRFEVKKWNAVATWSWDIVVDNCAICRNHIMDLWCALAGPA